MATNIQNYTFSFSENKNICVHYITDDTTVKIKKHANILKQNNEYICQVILSA